MKKFLQLVFNYKRNVDYLALIIYSIIPFIIAHIIGASQSFHHLSNFYRGYFDSYNWTAYIIVLPLSLFILRRVARNLGGDTSFSVRGEIPLVNLISKTESNSTLIKEELSKALIGSGTTYFIVICIALLINIKDLFEVLEIYWKGFHGHFESINPREKDWSVFFVTGKSNIYGNLFLIIVAYIQQIILTVIGLSLIVVIFKHNLFFLKRIYQRVRSGPMPKPGEIIVNIEDHEQCFGFRTAHPAFNLQIGCLVISGFIILISRLMNSDSAQNDLLYNFLAKSRDSLLVWNLKHINTYLQAFSIGAHMPDFGQFIMAVCWFLFLVIVSMPSFVKLLPSIYEKKIGLSMTNYLKSFLPDNALHWSKPEPTKAEIDETAKNFALNSFWPSGDGRAKVLFFFSFIVFLEILFPLSYSSNKVNLFILFIVIVILLSLGLTTLFISILKFPLWYVDPRLVKTKD